MREKYNKRTPNGYVAESYTGMMLLGEAYERVGVKNKINVSCWKNYLDKIKDFPTYNGFNYCGLSWRSKSWKDFPLKRQKWNVCDGGGIKQMSLLCPFFKQKI